MTSVPERPAIDRTKPPYKDDPVIAALTDEQVWALADVMARLATSYARKLEAAGLTVEQLEAAARDGLCPLHRSTHDPALRARQPRAPRPHPSRLAKWEAAWQAEQDVEAES